MGGPDAPMDRLQADPMLVHRPDFHHLIGMLVGLLRERVGEFFLNAAASSAVAEFGFFGRGDWIDQPIACKASHPRWGASVVSPS
jgi:hypothetical protein